MKENTKIFWRTVRLSAVWMFCVCILVIGIFESYCQIRRIGFAEYKNAVEYKDGVLEVLDFKL